MNEHAMMKNGKISKWEDMEIGENGRENEKWQKKGRKTVERKRSILLRMIINKETLYFISAFPFFDDGLQKRFIIIQTVYHNCQKIPESGQNL